MISWWAEFGLVKKPLCGLLVALLFTLGAPAAPNAARVRPNYVSLNEWARANVFSARWLERDKTIELTGRNARLTFNVDSRSDARRAQINGVQVWLAFPVLEQGGRVLISQVDLANTVGPVLSPPTYPRGFVLDTICLDPGHGGKDPGEHSGS